MMIRDLVFEKEISLSVEDPYDKALRIKNELSSLFAVHERKNEVWTDGPHQKNILELDIIENIDHYSHVILKLRMQGFKEEKTLDITAAVETITNVKETGFFSSAYAEYYMKTAYPTVSKACKNRASEIQKEIEGLFKKELANLKVKK